MAFGSEKIAGTMPLGDHLEELRSRLIRVFIALGVFLLIGFVFNVELKLFMVQPLQQSLVIAGPEVAETLGFSTDTDAARLLTARGMAEPAITSFTVSLMLALFATFPYLAYHIWGFILPALKRSEMGLAFFFLPSAVIFFYAGAIIGFTFGLPWFYAWLLEWAASDPTVVYVLEQRHYLRFFVMLTVCFGVILDIPWFILLLTQLGIVKPVWLHKQRRMVYLIAVVLAAMLSPPDPFSQIALFTPMVLLFEIGLCASFIMQRRKTKREAVDG